MSQWKKVLLSLGLLAGLSMGAACDTQSKGADGSETEATAESAEAEANEAEGDESAESSDAEGQLPVEATGVVAVVDGVELKAEAFNDIIRKRTNGRRAMPPQVAQMYKERTLEQVIDDYLITKKLDEAGVKVSEAEVEATFAEFKERFPAEEEFANFLEQSGVSVPEIKEDMRKSERLKKHLEAAFDAKVGDDEVKKYYDENPSQFERPQQVQASHILLKIEEGKDDEVLAKAKDLMKKARAGEDFATLAKTHSEGPSAKTGGDLGYFPRGRMVPEFDKVAFELDKGDVSEPVKTRFGYHVIKVMDTREAGKETFEEAKEKIAGRLEGQKFRKAFDAFRTSLREGAKIEEKPDNITVNVKEGDAPQMGGMPGGGQQIPPEVLEKIKAQMKAQQQSEGGEGGESADPTKLKLKKPELGGHDHQH